MVSMDLWRQIRMRREKGEGIKATARAVGISKNTIRRYLKSSNPPGFKATGYEKKLSRFREEVHEMLNQGYIGTRIYEELLWMDYDGSF